MKKIKYILLLFILSGCSVEYNINIDKNINLNENINILAQTEDEILRIEEYNGNLPIDVEIDDPSVIEKKDNDIEYYDINKVEKNIYFNYSYDLDNFKKNVFTNSCYEYVTATKNDNKLILATSKEFSCFEKYNQLEDVIVTITSKYKLTDTNADNIEKHKYIWYINEDNANNKRLYLSLDTSIEELTFLKKLMRGDYFTPFTISIMLLIIGSIIYLILKRKSNKVDAI